MQKTSKLAFISIGILIGYGLATLIRRLVYIVTIIGSILIGAAIEFNWGLIAQLF